MSENDRRYTRNRNKWRRTYPFKNRKPRQETFVSPVTQITTSYDLNRIVRHNDYFLILDGGETPFVVYFEGLAHFNHQTEVDVVFDKSKCNLQNNPIVTYTMETNDSQANVNVFGVAKPDTNRLKISVSAPFTGSVRYRGVALRDQVHTEYPLFIEGDMICPGVPSSSFWISAGACTLDSTRTRFTASYTIPTGSLEFRVEAHNTTNFKQSDVHFTIDTITISGSTGTISAPLDDNVHFQITSQ